MSLLSSGEFARRSRLSVKALRLYDQIGLLRPAEVEPGNGYRGYAESQLYAARLIALLRRLDMPLVQIAAVVAARGPGAAGLLDDYWAQVEQRLAQQRELAGRLPVPLNVLVVPGLSVGELGRLGVRRVSTGSLPYRAAVHAAVEVATGVRDGHPVPAATPYPELQARLVRYRSGEVTR